MVEDALDDVYGALADASRRAIVERLAVGEARVTDLATDFPVSLNAVSKHVKVLERAGLVQRHVRGREHWLSLQAQPMERAWSWMGFYRHFWESRLESLDAYLQREQPGG
jgi:DNA-binding transcriptional ArsR family regulator